MALKMWLVFGGARGSVVVVAVEIEKNPVSKERRRSVSDRVGVMVDCYFGIVSVMKKWYGVIGYLLADSTASTTEVQAEQQ